MISQFAYNLEHKLTTIFGVFFAPSKKIHKAHYIKSLWSYTGMFGTYCQESVLISGLVSGLIFRESNWIYLIQFVLESKSKINCCLVQSFSIVGSLSSVSKREIILFILYSTHASGPMWESKLSMRLSIFYWIFTYIFKYFLLIIF